MAARATSIPFSRMTAGINRRDREAGQDQCVEAENVIESGGDLVRRDAFRSVACAAPFYLPAGMAYIYRLAAPHTFYHDRTFTLAMADVGELLHIACDEQFDGFDWGPVVQAGSIGSGQGRHLWLVVEYWNGTTWVELPSILDTTERNIEDADGNLWRQPLRVAGRVSWHRSQMTDWATQTPAGTTRGPVYVVRVRIYGADTVGDNPTTYTLSGSGNLQIAAPGVKPFLLEPVRSLIPYRSRTGKEFVLIGSDRRDQRGLEQGANLGAWKNLGEKVDSLRVSEDEGACWIGAVSRPAGYRGSPGVEGGSWTSHAAASGSDGGSDSITKTRQDYSWLTGLAGQFRGAVLMADVAPNATGTQTAWNGVVEFNVSGWLTERRGREFEGFRIRATSGPNSGEEREIVASSSTLAGASIEITYAPPFTAVPDITDTYSISRPNARLRTRGHNPLLATERDYEVSQVLGAHEIGLTQGAEYEPDLGDENQTPGFFDVGFPMPWNISGGRFWSAAYDSSRQRMLLCNGKTSLLSFDGEDLRYVTLMTDPENARVQQWVGAVPEEIRELLSSRQLTAGLLRQKIPTCQFVVDFMGRIVVAAGRRVYWSAPAPDTDIWPAVYETEIRDADNHDISGMTVIGRQLVVFTPTSIHVASPPGEDGIFVFKTALRGAGPISHRATVSIGDGGMIYPSADGVWIFDGLTAQQVLMDWEDVLPDINTAQLADAAGAYWAQRNLYLLTLPGDEKILVFDTRSRAWWVWTAPWGGITEIATDLDENGVEQILFGTADGHIAVLGRSETDDGATVYGYAKTPTIYPGGLDTVQPTAVQIMASELGTDAAQALDLEIIVDGHGITASLTSTHAQPPGATGVRAPAGELDDLTLNTSVLTDHGRMVTRQSGLPAYESCEGIQIQVGSAARFRLRAATLLLSGAPVQRSHRS